MKLLMALVLALAAAVPAASFAQETAGRVLAVTGSVNIERGRQTLNAFAGTPVLAGDTLRLGPQSNAQVRFTDDSVVALGPDTAFQVSEYAYESLPVAAQRAFFRLITGGMRTITGLIGHNSSKNYRLQTATVSVGIRGTGFSACQDCTTLDGVVLPGTSVGFSEGAGYVKTEAGELELVAGQSAYANDPNALPVRTTIFPQLQQQASARPKSSTQTAQAPAAAVAAAVPGAAAQSAGDTTLAGASTASIVPVFQSTSTPAPETLITSSLSGTSFYRLAGPFDLPTTCGTPPCKNTTVVDGEFILAVNHSLGRATALAAIRLSSGELLNISIPISTGGAPIGTSGNQVTFSGTYNVSDFPYNTGAFECSQCGPNKTPSLADGIFVSGTINGTQATVTFGVRDVSGGADTGGSVTVTLPQQPLPNNWIAAMATQVMNGGANARSAAYWDVSLDTSGRLLQFGPNVGEVHASVGGATNSIVGTAPTAGNLVWGTWTNGSTAATKATITDNQYNTFQPGSGAVEPWITGEALSSLPPSLGVLTFNPIGSVLSNPNAHLNSAKLQADFVNQSLQLSINVSAAPSSAGTNTYQLNAKTGFSPTSNRFSAGFNSVTCTGPCNAGVGTPGGSFGGFFAGSRAQGAGVAFTAGFGPAAGPNGVGNGVIGAIAFGP